MKEILQKYADYGLSINQIAREIGLSYSQSRYLLIKNSIKTTGHKEREKWSEDRLKKAITISQCKSDILRALGSSTKSGNFQTLDRYCKEYGIDLSAFTINNRGNKFRVKRSTKDILCIDSPVCSTSSFKKRLIKEELLKEVCQICGQLPMWNGQVLTLQLDHINGIRTDNTITNLQLLCPNCHSQTKTFCKGNKGLMA